MKNFEEKEAWAYPGTNLASIFRGSIWTKAR